MRSRSTKRRSISWWPRRWRKLRQRKRRLWSTVPERFEQTGHAFVHGLFRFGIFLLPLPPRRLHLRSGVPVQLHRSFVRLAVFVEVFLRHNPVTQLGVLLVYLAERFVEMMPAAKLFREE